MRGNGFMDRREFIVSGSMAATAIGTSFGATTEHTAPVVRIRQGFLEGFTAGASTNF